MHQGSDIAKTCRTIRQVYVIVLVGLAEFSYHRHAASQNSGRSAGKGAQRVFNTNATKDGIGQVPCIYIWYVAVTFLYRREFSLTVSP